MNHIVLNTLNKIIINYYMRKSAAHGILKLFSIDVKVLTNKIFPSFLID